MNTYITRITPINIIYSMLSEHCNEAIANLFRVAWIKAQHKRAAGEKMDATKSSDPKSEIASTLYYVR